MGRGMHYLHSFYASGFNKKYGRVGHLFQDRYGSNRIWTPDRLRGAVDYIAQNPVVAGLCAAPGEYRWSSHALLEHGDAPRWVSRPADLLAIQLDLRANS